MADARRLIPSLLLALSLTWTLSEAQEPLPTTPPEEGAATQPPATVPPNPADVGTQAPPEGGTNEPVAPPGEAPAAQTPPTAPGETAPGQTAPTPGQPAAPGVRRPGVPGVPAVPPP